MADLQEIFAPTTLPDVFPFLSRLYPMYQFPSRMTKIVLVINRLEMRTYELEITRKNWTYELRRSPTETFSLAPGELRLVETGLALAIPNGCYGQLAIRSSLAKKGLVIE